MTGLGGQQKLIHYSPIVSQFVTRGLGNNGAELSNLLFREAKLLKAGKACRAIFRPAPNLKEGTFGSSELSAEIDIDN